MLTIRDLNFSRDGFHLCVNLELGVGLHAVIGPSGSGKSTLLSLIAGFEQPDHGEIAWNERRFDQSAPGKRPVAMLFQDNNLFPHLDILTNLNLGISTTPSDTISQRSKKVLAEVGLEGFEARKPGALSGGQQSRAALARTLLTDRPIVLMDEAFSALGPSLKRDMLELVRRLMPEKCILMVTHDPEDAKAFADQTIFIHDGKAAAPTDTTALFENPPQAMSDYLA